MLGRGRVGKEPEGAAETEVETATETEEQKKQRAVRQGASFHFVSQIASPRWSWHLLTLALSTTPRQSSSTLRTRTCRLTSVYMRPNVDFTAER